MTEQDTALDLSMTLTWRHGTGDLAPFLSALQQGLILGGCCPVCGRITVPPRRRCPQDGAVPQVVNLPTTATVRHVTTGTPSGLLRAGPEAQCFALLQVTGSHNAILARIDTVGGVPQSGDTVRLVSRTSSATHPIQHLVFVMDLPGQTLPFNP